MSCFRPQASSKTQLLLDLERSRAALEQNLQHVQAKVEAQNFQLQTANNQLKTERDAWQRTRAGLEAALADKTHVLTKVLGIAHELASTTKVVIDEQNSSGASTKNRDVISIEVQAYEDGRPPPHGQGQTREQFDKKLTAEQLSVNELDLQDFDAADDSTATPPEMRVERALDLLQRHHRQLVTNFIALSQEAAASAQERKELTHELASLRGLKEHVEAKAKSQMELLEVRCTALESSNTGLNDLNIDLQTELDRLQKQLASATETKQASQEQAARLKTDIDTAQARADAAETELRATQLIIVSLQQELGAVEKQLVDANALRDAQVSKLSQQVSDADSRLAERDAALKAAEAFVSDLQAQLAAVTNAADATKKDLQQQLAAAQRTAHEALNRAETLQAAAEEAGKSAAATKQELLEVRNALVTATQQATTANANLEVTTRKLADAKRNREEYEARLAQVERELSEAQSQASEANASYLAAKRDLVSASKQMATMAKEHTQSIGNHSVDTQALQAAMQELQALKGQLDNAQQQVVSLSSRAAEAEASAARFMQEGAELQSAVAALRAQVERKKSVLSAIVKLCLNKAAGEHNTEGVSGCFNAALQEGVMRIRLCDVPLGLLGSLASGMVESRELVQLIVDMDASRELVFERAGLRIAALAASLSLSSSIKSVELQGFSWDESGSGMAAPFLALGAGPGPGLQIITSAGGAPRGSAAPVPWMPPAASFTTIQVDTRLFDPSCASMLSDLLQQGLVDLKRPGGTGVLRLYTDHEALDEWYGEMLQHIAPQQAMSTVPGSYGRPSVHGAPQSTYAPSATSSPYSVSKGGARSAAPSVAATQQYNAPHAGSTIGGSVGGRATSVSSRAMSVCSATTSASGFGAASSTGALSTSGNSVPVDSDLSSEGLESHHMVLVMVVMHTCSHLRRLRLDGNKIGDAGAAVLALGLRVAQGLRDLGLARNVIHRDGAKHVARALDVNTSLKRLDISGQRFGGVGPQGMEALCGVLSNSNNTLTELDIGENNIGPSGAAALATLLYKNQALKRVGAVGNALDTHTARTLQEISAGRPGMVLML